MARLCKKGWNKFRQRSAATICSPVQILLAIKGVLSFFLLFSKVSHFNHEMVWDCFEVRRTRHSQIHMHEFRAVNSKKQYFWLCFSISICNGIQTQEEWFVWSLPHKIQPLSTFGGHQIQKQFSFSTNLSTNLINLKSCGTN